MAFSENLQFIRTQAGVTQEQLAEQLGVSRQSVSKWESGLSFPEMETLLRICDLYDVNLDTLLRGSVAESRVSDSARYDAFMNSFSRRVALAIGGILAGVALGVFLSTLIPELLSSAVILLAVTVAVVVLVASGIEYENFCKKNPVIADIYSPEEKDTFHQKFVWLISGGVGAILFGVVLLMLFFSVFPERALESLEVDIHVNVRTFKIAGAFHILQCFRYGHLDVAEIQFVRAGKSVFRGQHPAAFTLPGFCP